MLTLHNGPLALSLEPDQGAACKALSWTPHGQPPLPLWRPWPDGSEVFESACFALVPYSNRLPEGRLLTARGPRTLASNHGRVGCPVHGEGWRRPWQLGEHGRSHARLAYRYQADGHWPFDHSATQSLTLGPDRLRIELSLTNESPEPMPAGLGLHPRFAIDAGDQVCWDAQQVHAADHIERNDGVSAWGGRLRLDRRARGLRLRLRAASALPHLMVYRRADQPWLCLEPVSHATGAMSQPAMQGSGHGAIDLMPGQSLQAWVELHIEPRVFSPTPEGDSA